MRGLGNPPPGILASGSHCAVRREPGSSRTVLGGKGSLRRGTPAAPLPPARRSAAGLFATDGSAGNQTQCSFFVLRKTRTKVVVDKTS
jgi:hypothetical protein